MITYNKIGTNGRFGNQLFQYATLFSVAKEKNYEYGIPYDTKSLNEYYNFCLPECFLNLTAKNSLNIPVLYHHKEHTFDFDSSVFQIPDSTDIDGYYQTEKYFKKYRKELLYEYTFNDNISTIGNEFLKNYKEKQIISIHMRLGDYVGYQDWHPICTKEYYINALNQLPKDCVIFLFSDDMNIAKIHFKDFDRDIIYPETNDKFVDMYLMGQCDYHIIANSSFSWWGAWLSSSKQVIAPSQWFGPNVKHGWSDIYCEDWKII
jgi:hypothetical protein